VIVALLVGPIVTTLAGLLPVRRAAKVPPIQAMRGDTSREESSRPGWFAYLLAVLAALGVVGALVFKGTLAAVCLGLGAMLTLIAVAALAPLVLEPVLRVVGAPIAALGTMGRLARLNAMRQPRRTTTTAGALMVGVALVTFVSVFAAGVSAIAKDAFSDRVRADLGLSDTGNFGFPVAAQDVVAADPDVKRVVGLNYTTFDDARTGTSIAVTGVDKGLADVYRLHWVKGNDALLDQLGPRDVISDVSAGSDRPEIQNAKVGDRITLKTASGQQFTVTVRGTVDEGSTLLGGALIGSREAIDAGASQPRVQLSFVRLKPGADQATVQRRISKALKAKFPIVDALTRKELEDRFVGQINQLVSMIYAFLAFALLVSLLGISTTFTLTVQERRRELGMMRAIGTTRRQIRRLVRFEAVLTGLLGGVLGVAVGLGFGALVARLLDGFSYVIPIGSIIVVLIVAAIVAALAASLPARRAGRIDIVEAVTFE
jgi:putative ABC transport system permease protein